MRGILVRSAAAATAHGEERSLRRWALWLTAALALAALPVVEVRYPPLLDLPQQLVQIDLAGRALGDPGGVYRVQWWQPDRIAYPLLAAARLLGGDRFGPRLAVLFVEGAWIGALFMLARRFRRPPESAFVATVFLWHADFYGGYLHFLVGFAALAAWLVELERTRGVVSPGRLLAGGFLGGLLLYLAHVLWLAAGLAVLCLVQALERRPLRAGLLRLAGLAPWVVMALRFAHWLEGQGWGAALHWETTPLERLLLPRTLAAFLLGGLTGWTEVALLAGVALWLLTAARPGGSKRGRWQPLLAGSGLLLLATALTAPDAAGATALLACRWGPPGAALLVLGAPALVAPLRRGLAVAIVLAFTLATAIVWNRYERLFGHDLEPVIAAVRPGERVLELDFERRAPGLRMETLMHLVAYAELERRAEISYTFAQVPTSLVTFARAEPWREQVARLRHAPGALTAADLEPFQAVLLCSPRAVEREFMARFAGFREVSGDGPWRLLRRTSGGASPGSPAAEAPGARP
jgi:hypothetical protein